MVGPNGAILKAAAGGALVPARVLSLGLGLGAWGPVILGAVAAMVIYGYWKKSQDNFDQSETDSEIRDALG